MMISRRDSNKRTRKILLVVAGIVLFFALWSPFKSLVTPLFETTGLFSSRGYVSVSSFFNRIYLYMASNEALYKENIRLQDELTQEKLRYLEIAILKDNLRKYEGFSLEGVTPLIFAKRIGGIDTFVYDAFRIDKGNASGVQGGELIVGLGNTLVGVVSEVAEKTSHVSLLWNGDEFLGRTSIDGTVITLTGTDDGVYKALVPHEMMFQIGDVILYDRNPNLIIGVVKKINNNEEDRFKEIIVHVPFHPRMIDVVRVEPSL